MPVVTSSKRPIRSFVRRTGRMTPSQQKALDELWPDFGFSYSDEHLRMAELFNREAKLVLEIGFGNGESLVEYAAEHPDDDFLGIEVHDPGVGHCLLKARDAGITNLRLIIHDAIEVLSNQIPQESLQRVNLYFPDPWPKKRHHKRRIVQHPFLNLIADRLVPNGALHIATDWAEYAEHIDEVVDASDRFSCSERREHDGESPLDRSQTKFERRGLRKGHRIFDWQFVKSPAA